MEGPDYQFALLLQRQLEYENDNDTDLYLARSLQEDFNKEVETENPVTLVYDQKKKPENDARSLVDPSWELVDPTPNIYNLFVAFNQRFFWNNLVTVCVSWSKRMTSCAGICSYQGKGGMCSITLSEPLLKLRPRKDLVETLLHEMIHAYLFVTHNNKDRDGHGPEFHKHMFRINKEAGTNITVYHSFHDEVRLYKQHWWRCNGACQNRRPYFGMVRRTTNRAPGPYDRWWNEHTRTCGGVFVKVREPEKKTANQKGNKQVQKTPPAGDIRKFLPNLNDNSTKKPTRNSDNYSHKESININGFNGLNNSTQNTTKLSQVPANIHGLSNLTRSQNSTTGTVSKGNTNSDNYSHKGSTNINGFNDLNNFTQTTTKVSQVSGNIHGLSNLRKPQNSTTGTVPKGNTNNRVVNIGNATKTKSNSNSTIIVNKKPNTVDVNESSETTKAVMDVFAGVGSCLTSPDKLNNERYNDDYSVVRNHWLNKFPIVPDNVNKRNNSSIDECSKKRKTQSTFNQSTTSSCIISESMVGCPVCENQIKESLINSHLDSCLQDQSTKNIDTKQLSPICNKEVPENHVDNRLNEKNNNEEQIECEICNMLFNKGSIETHRRLCIEEAFSKSSPSFNQDFPVIPNNPENAVILAHCPVCDEFIDTQEINSHKAECLLNAYDDLDNKYNLKSSYEEIKCLVCSKKLPKNELNAHLDDCMGNVFDVKNDFNLCSNNESNTNGSCSGNCDKKNITKYNCPFCMELYSELDMSAHLDECLISDVDDNSNKSILIDSFSNKDIF